MLVITVILKWNWTFTTNTCALLEYYLSTRVSIDEEMLSCIVPDSTYNARYSGASGFVRINMGHRRSLSPCGVATLQTFPHVHTDIPLNGFCRGKHFYSFGRFIFSLGANKFPFLFRSHECWIWITITRTAPNFSSYAKALTLPNSRIFLL